MKNTSGFGLAMAAVGAIASAPAQAGPVTLTHSVALNSLLQAGASTNLSFDIGSFLANEGFATSEVLGGTVSVFGFSEASYGPVQNNPQSGYNVQTTPDGGHLAYYTYYVYGGYRCGWSYCSYSYPTTGSYYVQDYRQTSDRDLLHVDAVADQMQVTIGNTSATDTASTQSSSAGNFGAYIYDGTLNGACPNGTCSYTTRYHRERDVYSAVYGDLSVSVGLDAAALLDLDDDGLLQLGLTAPVGHFNVNAVSFDLLVQRTAPPQLL
ncbi:MAG: hypothetical protein Q7U26_17995, partial [Aquabacterium sp.]|nr:hypothetical protein [Aquabacterium sp.]